MKICYPCKIEYDEDQKFLVSFSDFPETFTKGNTLDEALFNASEALTLTLERRTEEGMDIPFPSYIEEGYNIYPSPRAQAALLIRFNRKERTIAEIARSLGTSWSAVTQMEDLQHWTTLRQLDKAASILGKRLVVSFEDNRL